MKWDLAKVIRVSRHILITGIFLIGVFFGVKTVYAASLYLSPISGSFELNSTFDVSVFVDTGSQPVNAIQADLTFPSDKLQVISPSSGKSLIQIWTAQPTYSNKQGVIKFQGAVPNPGISTQAGLISTITFRVKSIGAAAIKFSDTSRALLNDGNGTDILSKSTGGIYFLVLPSPKGPIVISRTNPNQEKWYSSKTVSFDWVAPDDIQGYSYTLNDNPDGEPDDISEGMKTRIAYNEVPDGVHYFHIKALRQSSWGGVTSYIVKIDQARPATFTINVLPASQTTDHVPAIIFATSDAVSGIDHYELAIVPIEKREQESNEPFFVEASSPYVTKLDTGHYQLLVRAYDKAGAFYEAQTLITISDSLMEILGAQGIRFGGGYTLAWPYVGIVAVIALLFILYVLRFAWRLHANIEEYVRHRKDQAPEKVNEKSNIDI